MTDPNDLPWSTSNTLNPSYDKSGTAFLEQYGTDFFATTRDTFTIPGPVNRSYDSIPSNISTSQLFELASNDGSAIGSSSFNDSSASSSRIGTRQDSFSDIQSRKASLSSTYDSTPSVAPERSPEVLAGVRGSWYTADEQMSIGHQIPHTRHISSISNHDMPSSTPFLPLTNTMTSQLNDNTTTLSNNTSPTHLFHSRSYSAAAYFARNPENHPASSSTSSFVPQHSLMFSQPQSSSYDSTRLLGEGDTEGVASTRERSSTSGSTRRLKFRRSRTGCMVCRKRKVKCDQDGNPCKQCRIGKRECHYDDNPTKRRRKSKTEDELIDQGSASIESTELNSTSQTNDSAWDDQMLSPNSALTLSNLRADIARSHAEQPITESISQSEEDKTATLARKEDEELKRKTDALFAQHTNIDQVGIEEGHLSGPRARGVKTELDPDQSFADMTGSRLDDSILSHTSMGSTSLSGTVSDSTLDSNFEADFAKLSNHPSSSTPLDFKHNHDNTAPSTLTSFADFNDGVGADLHYDAEGTRSWEKT